MQTFIGLFLWVCLILTSMGSLNNILAQTPDRRIIQQCKDQGYIVVKQTIVTCSIQTEIKK